MRGPRILPSESHFHLIARSNNGVAVCKYPCDYQALKDRLCRYLCDGPLAVYHYVLMKTHFHLLVWMEDTERLKKMMQGIQLSYWHYFKKRYRYQGHLWNSRYRSILIERDAHLKQCGGYIEVNPVHAGLVKDPGDYPWSSYRFHAFGEPDPLVTTNPNFVNARGEMNRVAYRKFVLTGIDMDYQRHIKRLAKK